MPEVIAVDSASEPPSPDRSEIVAELPPLSESDAPTTLPGSDRAMSLSDIEASSSKHARATPFIIVPSLAATEKASYLDLDDLELPSDPPDEDEEFYHIVGELEERGELSYFVKCADGLARKFPSTRLENEYPALVEQYVQDKSEGKFRDFNSSSSEVHPGSRSKLTIKIAAKNSRVRPSSDDEFGVDELAGGFEPESSNSSGSEAGGKYRKSRLPFSPRKTRSKKPVNSDSDVVEVPPPRRRSGRNAKGGRKPLNDAAAYATENDESSDRSRTTKKRKATKKGIPRGKASRPAYGRFRLVVDIDYDDQDDPETAPLRAHRDFCEKCHRAPANELYHAATKKKGRTRKKDEYEEDENDLDKIKELGGWVRCMKCPVSAHWSCLAKTQRDEILKAANDRLKAEWSAAPKQNGDGPPKQAILETHQTTEFICGACMKGGFCMRCREVVLKPDQAPSTPAHGSPVNGAADGDVEMIDLTKDVDSLSDGPGNGSSNELLFRCVTCKRLAHYAHLPSPPDLDDNPTHADIAEYYQSTNRWQCHDCVSFIYPVEHILAWRPYPEDAVESQRPANEPVNYKAALLREYLVKWANRSYKRTTWVPHMWLLATHAARLKNFLASGSKVELLSQPAESDTKESTSAFEISAEPSEEMPSPSKSKRLSAFDPDRDAERKIPLPWKTVDRTLDVLLWSPKKASKKKSKKTKRLDSDDEETPEQEAAFKAAFNDGEQPPMDLLETVDDYEKRTKDVLSIEDIDRVVWGFFKWEDLGYDDASWDSPPRKGTPGYSAFESAFKRYLASREVTISVKSKAELAEFEARPEDAFKNQAFTSEKQPQLGQASSLSLMPFQVEGVNWLCNNWWNLQHCILADEMGLGKTVQIVTFLGHIISKLHAAPALVVVPNSTVSNWVREFERWAPSIRVVPLYGESKAREIIKRYELQHSAVAKGTTGSKFHVLVTTYETVTNPKEFGAVFKKVPRWEVLVVDEGQRLKSDNSLIFKKLKELKTIHRIIMTGTPLNNNIRELFNLMNFLDPGEWRDLDNLSKQYEVLSEENIKELHVRLRPYFLRRVKSEVLQLPPKNEVIVPVSMAPLQREVYVSILSQNLDILSNLARGTVGTRVNAAVTRSNMNNVLMQLRKCIQHPYLISQEIEPKGLSLIEAHAKLIDASAKIGLLKILLPKLKARGHRVLLFSQFAMALDVIEDFLLGEGIRYLRLDGSTKQSDRQKGMDEFNKPGSDYFIYLLTTRAGGVGINLWSADTVVIFDPDFNPHQDLQAIARAHRFGQTKTCLVFKLMMKDSAEEKIMQTGKKKLVLDHLIVQNMDDDENAREDVQSILMYGAQTLFEEEDQSRKIHYSDQDVESLIEKTETEGEQVEQQTTQGSKFFDFAKVWSTDKDTLEEMPDEAQSNVNEVDSWAHTLERLAKERAKETQKEQTGRGVRRRAAATFPQQNLELGETPTKGQKTKGKRKRTSKPGASDESDAYVAPEAISSESETQSSAPPDLTDFRLSIPSRSPSPVRALPRRQGLSNGTTGQSASTSNQLQVATEKQCGLCGEYHGDEPCYMTNSSENLAEYRYMLLVHAGDEPLDERRAAIQAIDETLQKRGKLHLIYGQPLRLVEHNSATAQPLKSPAGQPPSQSSGAAVAGPSKRPAPSALASNQTKKARDGDTARCIICGQAPHNVVKDCPAVAEGPKRIAQEIKRLETNPTHAPTVNVLRGILVKHQRRALAGTT